MISCIIQVSYHLEGRCLLVTKDDIITTLEKTLCSMTDAFSRQTLAIKQRDETINQLKDTIDGLKDTIKQLNQTIAELKEQVNKNSKNSSKPPSSDGLSKPKPSSLRKPSGKKPGAQEGHKGSGPTLMSKPDNVIPHDPAQCKGCPNYGICVSCGKSAVRNVVDVEIKTTVVSHYTRDYVCPLHDGKVLSGEFPEGVNSSIQYGNGVRALVIALNTSGMMGINRVHEILGSVLGVPISTGTIVSMVDQFTEAVSGTVESIRQALLNRPVVHCDETGTRVEGTNYWVHSACDGDFTYLSIQKKRGAEGMENAAFLPDYQGIVVHDCWSPYWSFPNIQHALCCAHLLRELNGVIENAPDQADWARGLQRLLLEMNQCRNKTLTDRKESVDPETIQAYLIRYDKLMEEALSLNPLPERPKGKKGRMKKGKRLSLIERLIAHKGEVCLFINDLRVPFTNNTAEQSVRMVKVKTKVSGCFRKVKGAENFVTIMSYLQTAAKHSINAYKAILEGLSGNSYSLIFEG